MKKWIGYLMMGLLTAGTASAAWWPFGSEDEEAPVINEQAAPQQRMQRRDAGQQRHQISPEQREKMMAQRKAVMQLGEAARNETDPVKKEALVAELRTKLNEAADKMHAMHQKRLEKATQELDKLKQRMAEAEQNRDQKIEEQIQRILSGEPPQQRKGPGPKNRKPPVEE